MVSQSKEERPPLLTCCSKEDQLNRVSGGLHLYFKLNQSCSGPGAPLNLIYDSMILTKVSHWQGHCLSAKDCVHDQSGPLIWKFLAPSGRDGWSTPATVCLIFKSADWWYILEWTPLPFGLVRKSSQDLNNLS